MLLELVSPAILPLALVSVGANDQRKPGLLGVTLRHPPTHILIYPGGFQVTGARAHVGREYGRAYFEQANLPANGTFELERAIPGQMGLGSDAMLGLTMARGLNWVNNLPLDAAPAWHQKLDLKSGAALARQAFDRGGLVVTDLEARGGESPEVLARIEIKHEKRDQDWVFTLFLPRSASGTLEDSESCRLANLLAAQADIPAGSLATASDALLTAAETDDFAGFAAALMETQALNRAGRARAGTPDFYSAEEQRVLAVMRDSGALAWGRSAAGQALFGLVRGGKTSVEVCAALHRKIGFEQGMTIATLVDNQGGRYRIYPEDVEYAKHLIFNAKHGVL